MDGDSAGILSGHAFDPIEAETPLVGLAVTDSHDRFLEVNRALCEIVNCSPADLLGQPYDGIVHPEDRSGEMHRRSEVLAGRASTYTVDERYVRADGAVRWVTVRASVTGREQPVLIRRVLDVTERHLAAAERDRLFTVSPDVIAVVGFDGVVHRVNPATTRVLGWTVDDLRSLRLVDLLHPDDRAAAVAEFRRVLTGEDVVDVQARVLTRDGSYRWMSISLSTFPDQHVYYACARDVTPRRLAQEALERSEERSRRLFDASPIGLAVTDDNLCFLRVNPAYCEMVGYEEQELVGQSFTTVTHPDDVAAHATLAQRVLAGEIPSYDIEKRYVRQDGEVKWGLLRGTGVHDTDGTFVHLAMVEDVTELRGVEAARRDLDALKDSFVRVVAHDLQNPLVTIAGLADLLNPEAGLDAGEQRRLVTAISTHAWRLQRMVSTFLDLDRLYTNSWRPDRQPTDIGALAVQMAGVVDLRERPLTLEAEPVIAQVDPGHIERILENLLVNAATHTPPGTPVQLRILDLRDDVLMVVEDCGPGVPEPLRESVFELFRTGRPEERRTGIGLWVARRLAALHGGRAWVEDRPGGGASFRVLLPKCNDDDDLPG